MHIFFVISSLRAGGAERVASLLCSQWSLEHRVTLFTFDRCEKDYYAVAKEVKRITLGIFSTSTSMVKKIIQNRHRIMGLRKAIKENQPDIVVSFMDIPNLITLMSCFALKVPTVISERIDPSFYTYRPWFRKFKEVIYGYCTICVCQTERVSLLIQTHLSDEQIKVIPNPVKLFSKVLSRQPQKQILAMGRLDKQKGFDRLIEAFSKLSIQCPQWKLTILGEGVERMHLENLIKKFGLCERIDLAGLVKNPEVAFGQAAIFVLSSRAEGFPNALLEAMAFGLPVISFDCKSGPAELIQHGVNGLLVPEGDEEIYHLSQAMINLIENAELRDRLGEEAKKVKLAYSLEKISRQWITLFQEVIA